MKLKDYIAVLLEIQRQHGGDLEVETFGYDGRYTAPTPRVAHRMVLKGRERTPRFTESYETDESRIGEKVVRV